MLLIAGPAATVGARRDHLPPEVLGNLAIALVSRQLVLPSGTDDVGDE